MLLLFGEHRVLLGRLLTPPLPISDSLSSVIPSLHYSGLETEVSHAHAQQSKEFSSL